MISLSRRTILGTAAAWTAMTWAARAQDVAAVQAPIRTLYTALEALMRQGKATPFPKRFDMLAPVIEQVYDLDTVLRVSVGPRWTALDETARRALQTAFRRFTVATYVANFDSYDGEKFDIQPGMRSSGHDQIVATRIVPEKGDPIRLDYVLRETGATWRIVDVLLDGTISRVAVQRSDFRGLLGQQGDADALITSLQRKTMDLSGGTLHS
jgi:phospholipid transport system substrate-binding protein